VRMPVGTYLMTPPLMCPGHAGSAPADTPHAELETAANFRYHVALRHSLGRTLLHYVCAIEVAEGHLLGGKAAVVVAALQSEFSLLLDAQSAAQYEEVCRCWHKHGQSTLQKSCAPASSLFATELPRAYWYLHLLYMGTEGRAAADAAFFAGSPSRSARSATWVPR
jgi:hypothetical protein